MRLALLDRLFTICMLALGLFVTVSAWNYGLYREAVPGPGFFPVISGLMMTLLAAGILIRDLAGRERLEGDIPRAVIFGIAGVTAAILAFVYIAPVTGMAIAAGIAIAVIGYLTEEPLRKGATFTVKLVALSVATILACHILFGVIIDVPLDF
jgi:hypothetical protein